MTAQQLAVLKNFLEQTKEDGVEPDFSFSIEVSPDTVLDVEDPEGAFFLCMTREELEAVQAAVDYFDTQAAVEAFESEGGVQSVTGLEPTRTHQNNPTCARCMDMGTVLSPAANKNHGMVAVDCPDCRSKGSAA